MLHNKKSYFAPTPRASQQPKAHRGAIRHGKNDICTLILTLALAGCQSTEKKRNAQVPVADSIAMRPKIDVRTFRTNLMGKGVREVVKVLGQPTTAYTLDEREIASCGPTDLNRRFRA